MEYVNQVDRLLILSQLIKKIGPIRGEKCLQKLIYLVQEFSEPIGYNFLYDIYGPVSYEIEEDLDEAEALGIIKVSWNGKIPIYSSKLYKSNLSQFWLNRLELAKIPDKIIENLPKTKQILSNNLSNPLLMETIASLSYLQRIDNYDNAVEKLLELSNGRISKKEINDAEKLLKELS